MHDADQPRPFSAKLRRSAPSLRARMRRPAQRRGAALAAIGAVALVPLGWSGGSLEPAAARASPPALQPFESPGENFPGSAFYFLAPDSGVVRADFPPAGAAPAAAPLDAALGDAIARPTLLAGTAEDRLRALRCLTTAIYYEAATEPEAGQRAVAQVVLNRVAHPAWPNSVCGVVYQGSERPGCQFTFACDGSLARAPARMWWLRAQAVAERALAGEVYAPVGLATYYHTHEVHPRWAAQVRFVGTIGAHRFYRPPGAQGIAAAFTDGYFGGEPIPGPRPRGLVPATMLAAAPGPPGAAMAPAQPSAAAAPPAPPLPATDALPPASRIRPEYRNSGRWIADPKG